MVKNKSSVCIKFLVSLIGLIFFLSLLEFGLWLTGKMLTSKDNEYWEAEIIDQASEAQIKNSIKIVGLGDSFTHGGMVESQYTYPAELHHLLNADNTNNKFTVFNKGVCELNTRELLNRLPGIIKEYEPKIAILLVGSANLFNPWDYDLYAHKDQFSIMKSWFFNLRVVKMMRFIKLSLFTNQLPNMNSHSVFSRSLMPVRNPTSRHDSHMAYLEYWEGIKQQDDRNLLRLAWYYYNSGKLNEAIQYGTHALYNNEANQEDVIFALAHFYFKNNNLQETEKILKNAYVQFPGSQKILNGLTYYYFEFANWHKKKLDYANAIKYYLKSIALDPDADYFYYEMTKVFELQSYYDAEMIYDELNKMMLSNAQLAISKMFSNYLTFYQEKQKRDVGLEKWIHDDLNEIVALCKRNNIQLIIQNYPASYKIANRVLKNIAEQHALPFVDNESVFKNLEPKDQYLLDDDHSTKEGHMIMAENIYHVLKDESMLNYDQKSN